MLKTVDIGVAHMTKRDKALRYYDLVLDDDVPNDQDAYLIDRALNCYAVADGVGSSANADAAARAACEAFRAVTKERQPYPPVGVSERELAMAMLDRLHLAAMGSLALTTFTGLSIHESDVVSTASYLHAGDSQLLLRRGHDLIYLTSEHVHDNGYQLFNYLGTPPDWDVAGQGRRVIQLTDRSQSFSETKLEAEWGTLYVQNGDRFALMTDGIIGSDPYQRLGSSVLSQCMNRRNDADTCAKELLAKSRKIDDSTVVVVDIGLT